MRSLGGEGEEVVGVWGCGGGLGGGPPAGVGGGGGVWVLRTVEFWVFRVHTEMLDFPAV